MVIPLRRQNQAKEIDSKKVLEDRKKRSLSSGDEAEDVSKLKEKINLLESENTRLLEVIDRISLGKHESKFLSAIRSECKKQKTEKPVIPRKVFIKEYGIGEKYFGSTVKSLLAKKRIIKEEVIYSGKVPTFCWEEIKYTESGVAK